MNDLKDSIIINHSKVLSRDIEYIIDKTKTDCDELGYNFEQFKKALIIKMMLYISHNFDKKKDT